MDLGVGGADFLTYAVATFSGLGIIAAIGIAVYFAISIFANLAGIAHIEGEL